MMQRQKQKPVHKRYAWLLSILLLSGMESAQAWNVDSLTAICPQPVNCTYGSNFLSLADANYCGCCGCHGGAVGCSGGAKGRIICADNTVASACSCQYIVTPDHSL